MNLEVQLIISHACLGEIKFNSDTYFPLSIFNKNGEGLGVRREREGEDWSKSIKKIALIFM